MAVSRASRRVRPTRGVQTRLRDSRCTVVSFPKMPPQQAGYPMPSVEAQETSLHSGAWVAIVDHDAVACAPGEAPGETGTFLGPNGAALECSPVVNNAAALCAKFKLQFGACCEDPAPHRPSG